MSPKNHHQTDQNFPPSLQIPYLWEKKKLIGYSFSYKQKMITTEMVMFLCLFLLSFFVQIFRHVHGLHAHTHACTSAHIHNPPTWGGGLESEEDAVTSSPDSKSVGLWLQPSCCQLAHLTQTSLTFHSPLDPVLSLHPTPPKLLSSGDRFRHLGEGLNKRQIAPLIPKCFLPSAATLPVLGLA